MSDHSIDGMADRAERLIDAIASSIMSASEAAAERIGLAAEVSRIRVRMSAFAAVLETVGAQKQALQERLPGASAPMKALLERQLTMLTAQEEGILTAAGVPADMAAPALARADEKPTHKRDGRRFARVEGNGN